MRRNSYTIEVDRRRNCYSCGSFGHLARNYKNRGKIGQEKKIEHRDNSNNRQRNLNGEENLIVFN